MDVRYVLTGARTIQALIGGSVQFAQGVSSRTVPSAVLSGADAILIANFVDKFLFTMHSAPEINSMQDLKGKVVGVSGIGGSTDFATRVALREAGLIPDKDVAIRGVGGVAETVAAMKAKVVHAGTLSPPSSFVAEKAGFKMLFDMSTLGVDYVSSGLGVKGLHRVQPARGETVSHGDDRGSKDSQNGRGVFATRLTKHTRISDRELLKQSYNYMKPYFLRVPYPSFRSIKDTLDILAKDIPKAKDADPRRIYRQLGPQRDRGKRIHRECLWQIKWHTDSSPPTTISTCAGCPKDLWTERLPVARARTAWWRMKGAFWTWEGQTFSPHGYYTAAQGSGAMWAIERGGVMRESELRPTTAELRLTDMDRDGADASVMYGPTDPMAIADPELRRCCYEAYNDWLTDFCTAKPERLIGVPQLSMEDRSLPGTSLNVSPSEAGCVMSTSLRRARTHRSTMTRGSPSGP